MPGIQRWEYLTLEAVTDGRGLFADRLNELGAQIETFNDL